MNARALVALLLAAGLAAGCASLGSLAQALQAPRFESATTRNSELSLIGPSLANPVGGVRLRLWTRVSNPNPVGLTLSRLAGTLALEGARAADVSFPLGLPLPASADTVIPLDVEVSFTNLPRLGEILPNAIARGAVAYSLNGTVSVDAGVLGQPSFGPMTLLQGSVQTTR